MSFLIKTLWRVLTSANFDGAEKGQLLGKMTVERFNKHNVTKHSSISTQRGS